MFCCLRKNLYLNLKSQMKKNLFIIVVLALLPFVKLSAQCAQTANIFTFTYGGHTYEVVKELKNWTDAKACAVERGGYLVAIDSGAEKNYIMGQLMMSSAANINSNYYPVMDGGGASYIWTGGSDAVNEGTWYWQGSPLMSPFYIGQGTAGSGGGAAVGGAYVNWGCTSACEPDNFFYLHDQDALGLAMGSWPYGVAGQWNDIDINNTLYFLIEKNGIIPTPCATPTLLSAFNITTTSAKIRWTSTAPNFSVKYKTSTASSWTTVSSANDTLLLSGLIKNTTYNYQVKAICSATSSDTSTWTAISTFITLNDVGIHEDYNDNIIIYPNPANSYIQIEGIDDLNAKLQIITIEGKKLKEIQYSELSKGKININNLPKGVYFVKVISAKTQYFLKFIKY
jgi:hypothetical protein